MRLLFWVTALAVLSISWAKNATTKSKPKRQLESIRTPQNLQYSLVLPHSRVAHFRSLTSNRRISNGTPKGKLPPYAVQMEPVVQYSQKDPLYDPNHENVDNSVVNKNEIYAQSKILNVQDQSAESSFGPPYGSLPTAPLYSQEPHHQYYESPEPIIEIIIKESNESIPAPPSPPVQKKKKEPVHVFYVKYSKDPNSKDKVIYEKPIPAITPPSNEEDEHHEDYVTVTPESVYAPAKTTTLRAIIKPESEVYHSDSSVKITFGNEGRHYGNIHDRDSVIEDHEETAPKPAIAFPNQPLSQTHHSVERSATPQPQHLESATRPTAYFPTPSPQAYKPAQAHAQSRIQFHQQHFPTEQQLPKQNPSTSSFRTQHNIPRQPFGTAPSLFPNPAFSNGPTGPIFSNPTVSGPVGPAFPTAYHRTNPTFQPRPNAPVFGARTHFNGPPRTSFHSGPQRPFHFSQSQAKPYFDEAKYLQENYHTITTEQVDPPKDQLPPNRQPQTFNHLQQPSPSPTSAQFQDHHRRPTVVPLNQQLPHQKPAKQFAEPSRNNPLISVSPSSSPFFNLKPSPPQIEDNHPPFHQQPQQQFSFHQGIQSSTRPLASLSTQQGFANAVSPSPSALPPNQFLPQPSSPTLYNFQPQPSSIPEQHRFHQHSSPTERPFIHQPHGPSDRPFHGPSERPFQQSHGPSERPFQQSQGPSERPFHQSHGPSERPFQQSQGPSERPFQQSHGPSERPFQQSHEPSERPFQQSHGPSERPFQQSHGPSESSFQQFLSQSEKPFQQSHGPFVQSHGPSERPLLQSHGSTERPFIQSQNPSERPPFNHQNSFQDQSILHHQQNIGQFVPTGGELVPAISKYEQHLTVNGLSDSSPSPTPNHPEQQYHQTHQQSQYHDPEQEQVSLQLAQNVQKQQEEIQRLQAQLLLNQQQIYESNHRQTQNNYNQQVQATSPRSQYIQERSRAQSTTAAPSTSSQPYYQSTPRTVDIKPSTQKYVSSTANTINTAPETKNEEKKKKPTIELPDEVPDDLRQQLLSSGILDNADISVLDYDKVGETPLESLPPDQLANFFSAGGGQQLAASEKRPVYLKPNGIRIESRIDEDVMEEDQEGAASENMPSFVAPPPEQKQAVEMKVVHFDPETPEGQNIAKAYVNENATQVDPVALNDKKYNRYLPLKVSGNQFPLPDILKGKKITSVVVLAPVETEVINSEHTRKVRSTSSDLKGIKFVAGDSLQDLLKRPTKDNFEKWLNIEKKTASDLQSIVLLVTGQDTSSEDREIFMYDIGSGTVNKLSGELSDAFVEAAENNSLSKDIETLAIEGDGTPENFNKNSNDEIVAEGSENVPLFVDLSGFSLNQRDSNRVAISSGYSKTKHGRSLRRH